jgi:hypothetical protein
LYDALIGINVPSDKARAVVDAMECDMGTTLATKPDLEILRRDLENRFALVEQRIDGMRSQLDQKIENMRTQLDQKIDAQELRLVVKLGSMTMLGFGLVIGALRVWL